MGYVYNNLSSSWVIIIPIIYWFGYIITQCTKRYSDDLRHCMNTLDMQFLQTSNRGTNGVFGSLEKNQYPSHDQNLGLVNFAKKQHENKLKAINLSWSVYWSYPLITFTINVVSGSMDAGMTQLHSVNSSWRSYSINSPPTPSGCSWFAMVTNTHSIWLQTQK